MVLSADLPFLGEGTVRQLLTALQGGRARRACCSPTPAAATSRWWPPTGVRRCAASWRPSRAEHGGLTGLPLRRLTGALALTRITDPVASFDCDTWDDIAAARARIREHGHVLDEWITAVKDELGIDLDVDTGILLDLARDAAHGVARPAAPLTTFLVGYAAAQAEGRPRGGRGGRPQGGGAGAALGGGGGRRRRTTPDGPVRHRQRRQAPGPRPAPAAGPAPTAGPDRRSRSPPGRRMTAPGRYEERRPRRPRRRGGPRPGQGRRCPGARRLRSHWRLSRRCPSRHHGAAAGARATQRRRTGTAARNRRRHFPDPHGQARPPQGHPLARGPCHRRAGPPPAGRPRLRPPRRRAGPRPRRSPRPPSPTCRPSTPPRWTAGPSPGRGPGTSGPRAVLAGHAGPSRSPTARRSGSRPAPGSRRTPPP